MAKVQMKQLGDQLPDCPVCGMGNAMLDERVDGMEWFRCRDCGYHVPEREVVIERKEIR